MRVNAINLINTNRGNLNKNSSNGIKNNGQQWQRGDSYVGSMSYPIAFGHVGKTISSVDIKAFEVNFRRIQELYNITCPCCGIKMVSKDVFNFFTTLPLPIENSAPSAIKTLGNMRKARQLRPYELFFLRKIKETVKPNSSETLNEAIKNLNIKYKPTFILEGLKYLNHTDLRYNKTMIKMLATCENSMHPVEKEVFKKIKILHKINPHKTLQDIMLDLRPGHNRLLVQAQTKVFDKINSLAMNAPENTKMELQRYITISRRLVNKDKNCEHFKRKRFINEIMNIAENIPDGELVRNIFWQATSLPTSGKDINAFISKYSGTVKRQVNGQTIYEQRSSREIAQRLISESMGTVDHILATDLGGEDIAANKLIMCSKCNSEKSNKTLLETIQDNPDMIKNAQKHINDIIYNINTGRLRDFNLYPIINKDTLFTNSEGRINLDISGL